MTKTPRYKRSPLKYGNKRDLPGVKEIFLTALAAGHSPATAARMADVSRASVVSWRNTDPEFRKLWDDAVEEGVDLMEDEARRRAVNGVVRDVYHAGEVVGKEI